MRSNLDLLPLFVYRCEAIFTPGDAQWGGVMNYTTAELAELVAFKARLDVSEIEMLGIERALVEIVFIARKDLLERLRTGDSTAALERDANLQHEAESAEARFALLGTIIERGGDPSKPLIWPDEFAQACTTVESRSAIEVYGKLRAQRVNKGKTRSRQNCPVTR